MRRLTQAFLVPSLLAWMACAEPTKIREPTGLQVASGNNQSGLVGQPLPDPLVVKVIDIDGRGVAGVGVGWRVTAGGGVVSGDTGSWALTTSDRAGLATVTLTLGTTAGMNSVSASVLWYTNLAPVGFTATGLPGPAAKLAFTVQPRDAREQARSGLHVHGDGGRRGQCCECIVRRKCQSSHLAHRRVGSHRHGERRLGGTLLPRGRADRVPGRGDPHGDFVRGASRSGFTRRHGDGLREEAS